MAAADTTLTPLNGAMGANTQLIVTTCAGDCDGNDSVTVGELTKCINGFLGQSLCSTISSSSGCPTADVNLNGTVSLGEITQCVNTFLGGC